MNSQACQDSSDTDDLVLLNASLELAVAHCEDLAPAVFTRFFTRCPAAVGLFTVPDAAMPPLGCGQMVFELISLLLDSAAGKPYVAPYMQKIAADHAGFQVRDGALYTEFMAALVDVLAGLLGPHWNAVYARAWVRQSEHLLASLPGMAAPSPDGTHL